MAAFHKSPEHRFGLKKNALVNTERSYKSIDEIKLDLENRKVKGTLIDTYVAAEYMDKLLTKDIQVNRLIDESFGYGVVLSGRALHLENRCKDYLTKNRRWIVRQIEMKTREIQVTQIY